MIHKYSLLFSVFITGACVLVIELSATRILSPYFGNTIFSVSSVITVVLAALSFGYFYGGKLADKYPNEKYFFGIIAASGVSTAVLFVLSASLLPSLGYTLSLSTGPLVMSVILFLVPSFLLGLLSPFAIKLQEVRFPKKGIGAVSGEVFFWSTFGSIFGSLTTGFILIPRFGVGNIILGVSIVLTLLGLLPLAKSYLSKTILLILLFVSVMQLSVLQSYGKSKNLIYEKDGVYSKIQIYDQRYLGRSARFLKLDLSNSSAIFLDDKTIAHTYAQYFELYKIFYPGARKALALGGGAYTVPKAWLSENPANTVDVVEIEPSLYNISQEFFYVPKDPRLKNYVEDGRRFLHDTENEYDFVFSDVFHSVVSIPQHFTTVEFYELAKNKLSDNGFFVANIIGSLDPSPPSFLLSEMRTFKQVFPNSYFFAINSADSKYMQNVIFVGLSSDRSINVPEGLAQRLIDPDKLDLSSHMILTDNRAPVDFMMAGLLNKIR